MSMKAGRINGLLCSELEGFWEFSDMRKQAGMWEVAFKTKFVIEIIEGSQLLLKMCYILWTMLGGGWLPILEGMIPGEDPPLPQGR